MSTTKAKRHIHKYHKIEIAGVKVWACGLPTCNHYMGKHMEAMVDGKASLCWKCNEVFTLNAINMKNDKPLCDDCSVIGSAIVDFIEQMDVDK